MSSPYNYLERGFAVMGGTFDPIHFGHLAIAEAALFNFKLERVLFMPSGQPPHKPGRVVSPGEHRYQMVLRTVCDNPSFDVSRIEIDREGSSYTIDTIKALKNVCPPGCEIFFIIGADALNEILTWKSADELFRLCQFVAVSRPGHELESDYLARLKKDYGAVIHLLDAPLLDISGTALRERFTLGRSVSGLMPHSAEDYARKHGLYEQLGEGLTDERFEWAKARLKERISFKRFRHSIGVVEEACRLAEVYGMDVNKARFAALLHDSAKEYSADKKRALCEKWGIPLDEIISRHIDIAHSLLGAEAARRDYYVSDPMVLRAIRFHTTGHKNMSLLDKIILLADYIEPYREQYPPLTEMRRLAYVDINRALLVGMRSTKEEISDRGHTVHPWSLDAIKELKKQYHPRRR